MWTSTKSTLWLLLLSLVVAAMSMAPVHAVFRDWNPSDFVYYTSIGDISGSLSCPSGKVIYFGFFYHYNPTFDTAQRAGKIACSPGYQSCSVSSADTTGNDELYGHITCGPSSYYSTLTATTWRGDDSGTAYCNYGTIVMGMRLQFVDEVANNGIGYSCLSSNRQMCTSSGSSCTMSSCDNPGDDEGFMALFCSSSATTAFKSVTDIDDIGTTYTACPSGMWAVWSFNHHYGSDFTPTCMHTVNKRTCSGAWYSAWGGSHYNPAASCSGSSCNENGGDANILHTLCMCLPGYARGSSSASSCTQCSSGQITNTLRTACENCPAGYYCTRPDLSATACGAVSRYCPGGGSTYYTVSTGHYTTGGGTTTRTGQSVCSAGYYCTGGYQYSCGSNAYYCPGTGNSGPTTVSTGYYSTGGSSSTRTGQAICEPGYQCNSGVKTDCGGDNVYCPEGTSTPLPVSTGFYSTGGTSTTRSGQSQCTPGTFCSGGVQQDCAAGTYQPADGATSCLPCDPGFRSDPGADICTECPAGYYCLASHGDPAYECGGPDVYCPAQSGRPTAVDVGYVATGGASEFTATMQAPCPTGRVCLRGLGVSCGAGYTCSHGGYGVEVGQLGYRSECSLEGNRTEYCPHVTSGTNSTRDVVQHGYYTVGGRADCTSCGTEQFLNSTSGECVACTRCRRFEYESGACGATTDRTCAPCNATCDHGCSAAGSGACLDRGTYTLSATTTACEAGSYCVADTKTDCPAGRYGASRGLSTSACDGPCLHGFYCPPGSTRPDDTPCDDACFGCSGPSNSDCEACAPGYRDVAGSCVLCGACGVADSDAGTACEATTRTASIICPAGLYCLEGARVGVCTQGYYCAPGSTSPTQAPCATTTDAASFYCPTGTDGPVLVTSGHYTTPITTSPQHRVSQASCPVGRSCSGGFVLAETCAAHKALDGSLASGWAGIDPAGDGSTVAVVWCDHDFDGGDWTVLHASTGDDGAPLFVTDAAAAPYMTDSVMDTSYTAPLDAMIQLCAEATETLIYRSATEFLKVNAPPITSAAASAQGKAEFAVTLSAQGVNGGNVTVSAFMGFRRAGVEGGGDFYISASSMIDATLPPTDAECSQMYLYSSSSATADSDGAWRVGAALGSWGQSAAGGACDRAEGGGENLFIAVRKVLRTAELASCRAVLDGNPSAPSGAYTLGSGVDVWCDMETAGGGWTILYSTSGADGEEVATGDTAVAGNPFTLASFNLGRSNKAAFGSAGTQTLLWRGAASYIVASESVFGPALGTAQTSDDFAVSLVAADGSVAQGRLGWSTVGSEGGDLGLLLGQDAAFDNHDANAPMLNADCSNHLLYSSSSVTADSDAGYDAGAALGSWAATTAGTCGDGAEGGSLAFYLAMRDRAPLCPGGFALAPNAQNCYGVLTHLGPLTADAAAAACSGLDSTLVSVSSDSDNAALQGLVVPWAGGGPQEGWTRGWLGLSDASVEGEAVWAGGAAAIAGVGYSNWAVSQSGGVSQSEALDCAYMDGSSGDWHASQCANATALAVCQVPVARPLSSCKAILEANPDATSGEYAIWVEGVGVVQAECDMDTQGGGWTILWASNGVDGAVPFVSDVPIGVNAGNTTDPLGGDAYNQPLAVKAGIVRAAAGHMETLFRRSGSEWIVADQAPVDDTVLTDTGYMARPTLLTAPSGAGTVQQRAWVAFSKAPTGGGGDFTLATGALERGGSDEADLTNSNCADQLLYSLSSNVTDGDAAYGSATAMGDWTTHGSCDGAEGGGMALMVAVREAAAAAPTSCADILRDPATTATSVPYAVRPPTLATSVVVLCDQDVDGGGWDIVYAATGADEEPPITGAELEAAVGATTPFNTARATKVALGAARQSQLLFWRSATVWLVADCDGSMGVFGSVFASLGAHERAFACTLTASDGSSARGIVAWSTAPSTHGGDFAVLLGDDATFDRHDASRAPLLNRNCSRHLLYSYSGAVGDGDAAYGAAASLGSWTATTASSCGTGAEGSGMVLRVGVRAAPLGAWVPVLRQASFTAGRQKRFQPRTASFTASSLRVTQRDGAFACAANLVDAANPWDGCASTYSGAEAGFSMDVLLGPTKAIESPSDVALASACAAATDGPASQGVSVLCADIDVAVHDNEVLSVQPRNVEAAGASGSVALDMDALVSHTCPPLGDADDAHPQQQTCQAPGRWVKLVDNAVLNSAGPAVDYTVTLPAGASEYRLSQVKGVYQSGHLTCEAAATEATYGWAACFPSTQRADGGVPLFFELLVNDVLQLAQSSTTTLAPGCVAPPPSHPFQGDFVCDLSVTLQSGDKLTPTWVEPRTGNAADNGNTQVVFDLWGFVLPTAALNGEAVTVEASDEMEQVWVLLLSDAGYGADEPNVAGYAPDLHGAAMLHVNAIRAVHRSGNVSTLSSGVPQNYGWPWDAAVDAIPSGDTGGNKAASFGLKHNGVHVLQAANYYDAPAACTQSPQSSGVGDGDFVCDATFTLLPGDTLVPTTWEAEFGTAQNRSDNSGQHYIDLWALVNNTVGVQPARPTDHGIIEAGTSCTSSCSPGLTLVGDATRTCKSDGTWSGATARCLALAEFEALAPELPALHAWSFDSQPAPGRVLDDLLLRPKAGQPPLPLAFSGDGVAVVEGTASDLGCAVGRCVRVTACGSGLVSESAFNSTALGGERAKSLSAWVRLGADTATRTEFVPIVSIGGGHGHGYGSPSCLASFTLGVQGGKPVGRVGSGCAGGMADVVVEFDADPGAALGTAAWRHLALVHDGWRTLLYVDGQQVGEGLGSLATRGSSSRIVVGGGDAANTDACNLGVDEVRVFEHALSAGEVSQLHAAARRCPQLVAPPHGSVSCDGSRDTTGSVCVVACDSSAQGRMPSGGAVRICQADGTWSGEEVHCVRMADFEAGDKRKRAVHWWDLDSPAVVEGTSLLAFDDVGTTAGAALVASAASVGAVVGAAHEDTSRAAGGMLSLTSSACSQDVHLESSGPLADALAGCGPRSLSLWYRVHAGASSSVPVPLVDVGGSASCAASGGCDCGRLSTAQVGGMPHALAYADAVNASGAEEAGGVWVHVAAVYDGSTLALFVNGALAETSSASVDASQWAADLVRVGQSTLGGVEATACNVDLDDVKVFARALDAIEVAELYQVSFAATAVWPGPLFDCATEVHDDAACGVQDAALETQLAAPCSDDSSAVPLVLTMSGSKACSVSARRWHNTSSPALTPGATLALSVTFSANAAFRCGDAADGTCPTLSLAFEGSAAVVELPLTPDMVSVAPTGRTVHTTCGFQVPDSATHAAYVAFSWSVPGTSAGALHGGKVVVHDVTLSPSWVGEHAWANAAGTLEAAASLPAEPNRLVCGVRTVALNDRAAPPASCEAVRALALGSDSAFVSAPPSTHTSHLVDEMLPHDESRATLYRQSLPDSVASGDQVRVLVRAVDKAACAAGTCTRVDGATAQVMHVHGIRCVSGETRRFNPGTFVPMLRIDASNAIAAAQAQAATTVDVAFDGRASASSTLDWQLTTGDCAGLASQCSASDIVASGSLAGGDDAGSACSDATKWCRFVTSVQVADVPAGSSSDLWLWLRGAIPSPLPNAERVWDHDVFARHVATAMSLAAGGVGSDVAVTVEAGDGWRSAGVCEVAAAQGGAYVEYEAYIDAGGDAAWQVKLQNAAIEAVESGLYWIDPNGATDDDAVLAYCDQDTDDGGWTLVAAAAGGSIEYTPWQGQLGSVQQPPSPEPPTGVEYALGLQASHLLASELRTVSYNGSDTEVEVVATAATTTNAPSLSSAQPGVLRVGAASRHGVCSAWQAQRAWCSATSQVSGASVLCGAGASLASVDGLHEACTEMEVATFGDLSTALGEPLASSTTATALFVRGGAAAATSRDSMTSAAAIADAAGLASSAQSETPLCGALNLGQSRERAARSCSAIVADYAACSSGTVVPPDGVYWVRAPSRVRLAAIQVHCAMAVPGAGTGWTKVASVGGMAATVSAAAYMALPRGQLRVVDTHGQLFNQVLVQRTSAAWCNGEPHPGASGAGYVAVSFESGALVTAAAFNSTGAVVLLQGPEEDGTGLWNVNQPAAGSAAPAILGEVTRQDGSSVVWTKSGDANAWPLAVGTLDTACSSTDAGADAVRVVVYVRDSEAVGSDAAASLSASVVDGTESSLSLSTLPSNVAVTDDGASQVAELRCTASGVDAVASFAAGPHPGLAYDSADPLAPVPQLAHADVVCLEPASALLDVTLDGTVTVDTLDSEQATAGTTSRYGAARDCAELLAMGYTQSAWYDVFPGGAVSTAAPVRAFCDQEAQGGGWTVVFVSGDGDDGELEYQAGLESLVRESESVLLSFRDATHGDATYSSDTAAATASWAVLETPAAWRVRHPGTANATDVEVATLLAGESSPTVRQVRYGRTLAAAGPCSMPWLGGDSSSSSSSSGAAVVAGRVCIEGSAAAAWSNFAGDALCGSSSSGASESCSSDRQWSMAVRGSSGGVVGSQGSAVARLAQQLGRVVSQSGTSELRVDGTAAVSGPTTGALGLPTSCVDVLRRHPGASNGVYDIQPVDASSLQRLPPRRVYCDLSHGGWQRCARLPAAGLRHGANEGTPMLSDWSRGGNGVDGVESADCGWALRAGAVVSVSTSATAADPVHQGAAVLTAPADPTTGELTAAADSSTALHWRASGRGAGGVGVIGAFTVSGTGLSRDCMAGSPGAARQHGPMLWLQGTSDDSACSAAGAYAGVHGCAGCADRMGAYSGRPWRGRLSFWVLAPPTATFAADPVPPPLPRTCTDVRALLAATPSGPAAVWANGDDAPPVLVDCDMQPVADGTEAWTVVYASNGDSDSDGGTPSYAAGTAAIVASASEVRLAVSPASRVASVTATEVAWWVALAMPPAWRGAHPASFDAVSIMQWPMRSATSGGSATGTLRYGRGMFEAGAPMALASPAGLCSAEWGWSNTTAVPPQYAGGRICAILNATGYDTVAWSGFGVADADSDSSQTCSGGNYSTPVTGCDSAGAVFSIAVRHAAARGRAKPVQSCQEVQAQHPASVSGSYTIYPTGDVSRPVAVECDFDTDGGGWTVVDAGDGLAEYVPGTAALVNDARNEVLVALRDSSNGVDVSVADWAWFPIPAAWQVRHPGAATAEDVAVTVHMASGDVSATVRFGTAGVVGATCGSQWDETRSSGRVCVQGTSAPMWSDFADADAAAGASAGGVPAKCGRSDSTAAPASCATSALRFTLAVRRAAGSTLPRAGASAGVAPAASCGEVMEAGASASGVYPLYPVRASALASEPRLPASCVHLLRSWPTAPSGMYTLMPPAAASPVRVYCDMSSGGFMHCGTVTAGAATSVVPGRATGGSRSYSDERDRGVGGYSVDCAWAMVAGAAVSFSTSIYAANSGTGALLTGDAHAFHAANATDGVMYESSTRWAAIPLDVDVRGDANAVVELAAVNRSSECGNKGIALLSPTGVDSGIGMCGSSDTLVAGVEMPAGSSVALWVREPELGLADAAVKAQCDLETQGGGWTMVFSTADSADGDSTGAGLAGRAYRPEALPFVRAAKEVLLALRDHGGSVVASAAMPMPPQWRVAHPSAYSRQELEAWPVRVNGATQATLHTVRYGSSAVAGGSADRCDGAWVPADSHFGGLLCVKGAEAPLWAGWSTGTEADVCGTSGSSASGAPCTNSNVFTISVRE